MGVSGFSALMAGVETRRRGVSLREALGSFFLWDRLGSTSVAGAGATRVAFGAGGRVTGCPPVATRAS